MRFVNSGYAQRLARFESSEEYQARNCELEEQTVIAVMFEISSELWHDKIKSGKERNNDTCTERIPCSRTSAQQPASLKYE